MRRDAALTTTTASGVLGPGLRVVIAGTRGLGRAPQLYYAGPGNHFWTLLHESGLVPELLGPEDASSLLGHGIGLTDVVVERIAVAGREVETVVHSEVLAATAAKLRPGTVAFVSKTAARVYARGAGVRAPKGYGLLPWTVGDRPAFVLPGPSGANNGMPLPLRIAMWSDLTDYLALDR